MRRFVAVLYAPIFLYEIPFALGLTPDEPTPEVVLKFASWLALVVGTVILFSWSIWKLIAALINRSAARLGEAAQGLLLATCLWFAGFYVADRLHAFGFYMMGRRAEPVIAAMERYVAKHGVPPGDIQRPIPEFLQKMPSGLPYLQLQDASHRNRDLPADWGLDIERAIGLPLGHEVLTYQSTGFAEPGERLGRWVLRFKEF